MSRLDEYEPEVTIFCHLRYFICKEMPNMVLIHSGMKEIC